MLKEAYYFPHFCHARHDRKIKRLEKELGIEGYGIFFKLLEVLREQLDLKYPIQDIDLLAQEFGSSEQKIRTVICNYQLFELDDKEHFFSPRLILYLQPYLHMKEQRRIAGIKSGKARKQKALRQKALNRNDVNGCSTDAERMLNGCSTDAERMLNENEQMKVNEMKVNEMKVKDKEKIFCDNSVEIVTTRLLLDKILQRNPSFKLPNIQKWTIHIDRMIKIDKRDPKEIQKVIVWCQEDSFWQNNILSTRKLREHYDQLKMKMNSLSQQTKTCAICGTTTSKEYRKGEKGILCTFCFINRQGVVL